MPSLESDRLLKIKTRIDNLLSSNRSEVGSGKTISEIEQSILKELLQIGKLLLEERIEAEESNLEEQGYEIQSEVASQASSSSTDSCNNKEKKSLPEKVTSVGLI